MVKLRDGEKDAGYWMVDVGCLIILENPACLLSLGRLVFNLQ
jgi:hypothetical protein